MIVNYINCDGIITLLWQTKHFTAQANAKKRKSDFITEDDIVRVSFIEGFDLWIWVCSSKIVMNSLFCVSEFAKEKARQSKSGKFQKIREKHMVDEAVKGYRDWIRQAGDPCTMPIAAVGIYI